MFIRLGFYYLIFSFFGGLLGFSFSIAMRIELNNPFTVLGGYFYYFCLTSHGLIMIFYFLTPLSLGFFYYFIYNVGFLKGFKWIKILSVFSFILMVYSLLLIIMSIFLGEGVNVGWTMYTPLSSKEYNSMICLDVMLVGLNLYLISTITSSLSILNSIFYSFFNFESFLDASVFIWSFLLTSFLILFSTPSLFCVLTMLLEDRVGNTFYFDCEFGGSSILFQSLFWFYSHPAVYIVILPIFGVISQVLFSISGNFLYNKNGIIFSMFSLSILSFLVWGHHMTTVGWGLDIKNFFMICTLVISLPTGVKVFSWLYTLLIYGNRFNLVSGFISIFLIFFSFGGITGVFLANYSLDVIFHDSYFIVGHFHTVLSSASVFGLLSGIFLFSRSIFNMTLYSNTWILVAGSYFFLSLLVSLIQFLYTLHLLGTIGVPRRVFNFSISNYLIFHIGSFSFLGVWFSLLLFLFVLLKLFNGRK